MLKTLTAVRGYRLCSMPELLIATTNAGKIREIRHALAGSTLRILTLADLGESIDEPEENRSDLRGERGAQGAALRGSLGACRRSPKTRAWQSTRWADGRAC